MDVFAPTVPAKDWHPNFRHFLRNESEQFRRVISGWADGFQDRDGKFVREFQTTMNSSFWELYLHAALKEIGYVVDFKHAAPDFVASMPSGSASFEAVIASHADGFAPEWARDYSPEIPEKVDLYELVRFSAIRLAQAITAKHRKYVDSYGKLSHVAGKPYVICVAPMDQPFFFLANDNALRQVLYGFDRHLVLPDSKTGELRPVGVSLVDSVTKDSGAAIPVGFFLDDRMKEVSAVLFSQTWAACKVHALSADDGRKVLFRAVRYQEDTTRPEQVAVWKPDYHEKLLDGLHLCLNPFAATPLDVNAFSRGEIAIHRFDPTTRTYGVRAQPGFLIQRQCMVINVKETIDTPTPVATTPFRAPKHPDWPEGVLQRVLGDGVLHEQFHLAHYRGWTLLVALDKTDQDWMVQALTGSYFSVPQYMEANGEEENTMFVSPGSYLTKEAALAAAKSEIDTRAMSG